MGSTRRMMSGLMVAAVTLAAQPQLNGQGREAIRAEIRAVVKSVDVGAGTIAVSTGGGRETPAAEQTYALAKNVEVAVGSYIGRGLGLFKEGKIAELAAGHTVLLSLSANQKSVESILVEAPVLRGVLKAVDAKQRTLTITQPPTGREQAAEEKSFTVPMNAEVAIDDGRGRRFSIREGKLDELVGGSLVILSLSLDKTQVQSILAEGATLSGVIKSVDAGKNSVTLLVRPARGDEAAEERTLRVAAEGVVIVDDGKGRRLSLKEAKLADVPIGGVAMVKLSVDQNFAMLLRVEGPTEAGMLKSVNADKGTITIAIPKGRGEDPEEKTFTLAKDVRVMLDGSTSKLDNLKAGENGPMIQLRLSLDRQIVQTVLAWQPRPRE
jgi:hypothetical protein